jgi:hypothetical protein
MGARPAREIRKSLLRKGFVEEKTHHVCFGLCAAGRMTKVSTFYSHGAQECDDYILGKMAKHLKLTRAQFDDFIDCRLSGEAYLEMLRELGDL